MMTARTDGKLVVLGGSGRVGGLLRRCWVDPGMVLALWHRRRTQPKKHDWISGDLLTDHDLLLPDVAGARAFLVLAGAVTAGGESMLNHSAIALAALELAKAADVEHVFLVSSSAVYGRGCASDFSESDRPDPVSAYGRAKYEMETDAIRWKERLASHAPGCTVLRIGNVAGADQLLADLDRDITLDRFEGGKGAFRNYIGPVSLARVISSLVQSVGKADLPQILNVAASPPVHMDDLLTACGLSWRWREAPSDAIERVTMDVSGLEGFTSAAAGAGQPLTLAQEWHRGLGSWAH